MGRLSVDSPSGTSATGTLLPTAVKTAAYTAAPGDLVPVDTTSGSVTVTLPAAPVDKALITVKHVVRGGTNVVTLACGGADVFNKTGGATTGTLTLVNQSATVQYNAATAVWYVTGGDLPLSGLDARLSSKHNVRFSQNQTQQTPAMASPPAVGALSASYFSAGGSTSSITGKQVVSVFTDANGTMRTSKFTFLGWPYKKRGTSTSIGQPENFMATTQAATFPAGVEFLYYGAVNPTDAVVKLELIFFGATASSPYRVWVDGKPIAIAGSVGPSADGANHNLPITFAAAGLHTIRVQTTYGVGFGGVTVGPTDTVMPSPLGGGPQALILSDSYGDGANGVAGLDTWPNTLMDLMGIKDFWLDAQGGTGLTTSTGSTKNPYITRLQADVLLTRLNPSLVIVQGSTNDFGASSGTISAALAAVISQVRVSYPNAFLAVTGVMVPTVSTNLSAGNITNNTALRTTATAAVAAGGADLFIDPVTDAWFSGTGRTSALTNSGNGDIFMSSDQVHPSPAGHGYIAQMVEQYLAGQLSLLGV